LFDIRYSLRSAWPVQQGSPAQSLIPGEGRVQTVIPSAVDVIPSAVEESIQTDFSTSFAPLTPVEMTVGGVRWAVSTRNDLTLGFSREQAPNIRKTSCLSFPRRRESSLGAWILPAVEVQNGIPIPPHAGRGIYSKTGLPSLIFHPQP